MNAIGEWLTAGQVLDVETNRSYVVVWRFYAVSDHLQINIIGEVRPDPTLYTNVLIYVGRLLGYYHPHANPNSVGIIHATEDPREGR